MLYCGSMPPTDDEGHPGARTTEYQKLQARLDLCACVCDTRCVHVCVWEWMSEGAAVCVCVCVMADGPCVRL